MEELCSSGGGWTRIAYLNMSDCSANCPPGFRLYQSGTVGACGRQSSNNGGCQSVKFPSYSNYSQMCGRVVEYQMLWIKLVEQDLRQIMISIVVMLMVSVSHMVLVVNISGHLSPDILKMFKSQMLIVPVLINGTRQTVQYFIGSDYFCEFDNPVAQWQAKLYTADPLWDGNGCDSLERTCCQTPGLPWFHKVLNSTTTH